MNAGRANSPTDPVIEPARVFDNLYVVGRTSTAVWIVTTSAGIVLIDSGYADQLESVLLPGMKTLGLDPAQVRYVIVGHGHGDHFGGSTYFQQRGARVVMAGPDWDLVETPPPRRTGRCAGATTETRHRRRRGAGDRGRRRRVHAGHDSRAHARIDGRDLSGEGRSCDAIAGLFGGSILTPGRISDDGLRQYIDSVEHWADVTRRMNVDVEIQNHPMYDGFLDKLERLKRRKPANPIRSSSEGSRTSDSSA